MFKIVLLLAAISGSLALENFDKCSTGEIPTKVEINHCNEAPCTFYKGQKIEAHFNGVPASDSVNATFNVDSILAGTRTPVTLSDPNACPHVHPACPIKQGEYVEFKFELLIREVLFGGVPLTIEYQLKDDDNMNLFCISFPATVFDSEGPTTTTEATPSTDTTISDADTTSTTVSEADTTTVSEADSTTVPEDDTTTASDAETTTASDVETTVAPA